MDFVTQCEELARKTFSLPSLRPAQREVLTAMQTHPYILATLPTGAGKTLLYALSALVLNAGPVLVISPLVALMRDQVRRMKEANIACTLFTFDQSEEERRQAWASVRDKNTKMIFASPERFVLPSFLDLLSSISLSMAVVDEAHCVVSWGHNFRPEYAEIGKSLEKLKVSRILALTATASRSSRQDICQKVFPVQASVYEYTSKPIAAHLFVESMRVFSQEEQWQKLLFILKRSQSKKTLVYFFTRKQCEEYAKKLRKQNIHSVIYHAGLAKEERKNVETYVHSSEQRVVICATTAFGMGVDIAGITLVVIYGFPSNIEEFFQMLGRAGRSGEYSHGVLLWTGSDPVKRDYQLKSAFPAPATFLETCARLGNVLPAHMGESVFIEKEVLLQKLTMNSKGKDRPDKILEGILSGLRICGCLEDPLPNETYFQIVLPHKEGLVNLLGELPETPTKRRSVLEATRTLMGMESVAHSGSRVVFSQKALSDISNTSAEGVEHVFLHYASQKKLQFAKIDPKQSTFGVIIKHGYSGVQRALTKYVSVRNHFFSSLHELHKLSTASSCRLTASFHFFATRPLQGAQKADIICMQCDICIKNEISRNKSLKNKWLEASAASLNPFDYFIRFSQEGSFKDEK